MNAMNEETDNHRIDRHSEESLKAYLAARHAKLNQVVDARKAANPGGAHCPERWMITELDHLKRWLETGVMP